MQITKKITKEKCRYFPKMLRILGFFFANEVECERAKPYFSNKVIVPNATSVLIFEYKKISGKRVSKNIIQLVAGNR